MQIEFIAKVHRLSIQNTVCFLINKIRGPAGNSISLLGYYCKLIKHIGFNHSSFFKQFIFIEIFLNEK